MSSPAQSFASDMKSPSGRPPSGFWPWQQEHFVLFGDIVFYLADEVFGQELHFGYKHHIWSLIIYELVPSLPVISVFLPPPGFSSAPLGLTHSGAEKWWEWLAYNIWPFSQWYWCHLAWYRCCFIIGVQDHHERDFLYFLGMLFCPVRRNLIRIVLLVWLLMTNNTQCFMATYVW